MNTKKTYYADVRIFVQADNAEEAAQEINDAVHDAVHSLDSALTAYDIVVEMDIEETK